MTFYHKGIFSALGSGLFWGLGTSLTGWAMLLVPFVTGDSRLVAPALLFAFFHDSSSAIWLTLDQIIRGEWKQTLRILNTSSVKFVMLGSIFGGPIGMIASLYAIHVIGAGYAASISALYPVLAAILGSIFLKDKLKKQGWIGLLLSVIAIVLLGYSQLSTLDTNAIWGFIAACVCMLGWAIESVVCAYGMKEEITPKQALVIRQWTSSCVYLLIIALQGNLLFNINSVITSQAVWIIALIALVGTLSYLCYYVAIAMIGPVRATGINVTYSLWAVIFGVLLFGEMLDWKLLVCGILIITGTSLVATESE